MTIEVLTSLLSVIVFVGLLSNKGRSPVREVNERLGLDVLRSSSSVILDDLEVHISFVNVRFGGMLLEVSVFAIIFEGVIIFNECDEEIVLRES